MTRAAGLDLSTAATGLALPDGALVTIRPRSDANDRNRRLHEIVTAISVWLRRHPPLPDVAVIEGYALHSKGRLGAIRLAEVGGAVRCRLNELGIPTVELTPTELKRYATGNGNADKAAVIDAARALGAQPRNDDEADAYMLRHAALNAYGLTDPIDDGLLRPTRLDVIAAHTWPNTRSHP